MKSRTTASLLLFLIFILGSATGAVICYLYLTQTTAETPDPLARERSRDSAEDLARALALDGDQKDQLKAIITESRNRYRTLSHQFRPQYDLIRQETNESIESILRPDQQARFDEMLREIRSQHKSRDHDSEYY